MKKRRKCGQGLLVRELDSEADMRHAVQLFFYWLGRGNATAAPVPIRIARVRQGRRDNGNL